MSSTRADGPRRRRRMHGCSVPLVLAFVLWSATVAAAEKGMASGQGYPARPVRLLVGFSPGGGTDLAMRIVGRKLSELWGQQVVVDNRPGAGGLLAFDMVAKAIPDGYTLLAASPSFAIQPNLARQAAVRPEPRFHTDHRGDRRALPARRVPGGRGEIGEGADRARERRARASSTTPRAASAARSTSPPSFSPTWPASTWSTFRSRAR